jgi:glutamyl-tRNA reductase
MTRSIVTRILKDPIQCLKANTDGKKDYAAIISKIFRLDEKK